MAREGQRLTAAAQEDRDAFDGDRGGGCACHISPPCSSCTHPGNPMNQDEDDECWETDDETN